MELTALILGATLVTLLVITLVFARHQRDILNLSTADDKRPIVDFKGSCEGCKFFSLEGGQGIMNANPAFIAASQVLPPWQMGQPQKVKPNPEYDILEARMKAAGNAGDHKLEHQLHDELLKIRPGELLPPKEYVGEEMLKAQWSDFGACDQHSELRLKHDCCPEREAK